MFPVHISIAGFHMFFYEGLYFALAIGLGMFLGFRKLERHGFNENQYLPLALWSIAGAMLGGRLFHVVFWGGSYYLSNPADIIAFWKGGISITGGIAGALVVALVYCRRTGQSFVHYLALLAPVILIAQGAGRIGCFLNGDAFGIPTDLPWGLEFARYGTTLFSMQVDHAASSSAWQWCMSQGLVAVDSVRTVPLHPTQLYEALFDFVFAGGLVVLKRRGSVDSMVAYLYLAGYSLFRFLVEYIRGDREEIVALNTSLMQFFLIGTALLFGVLAIRAGLGKQLRKVPGGRDQGERCDSTEPGQGNP